MIGAFLYLTACSFRNRLRRRLQRLREPRYLVGLLVGLAYFYLMFFRRRGRRRAAGEVAAAAMGAAAAPVQFLGSLFLFASAVVAWVWPSSRPPLQFSRAEVQFLFTAPVTRRQLVHFMLWRSQLAILFGSAIATLVLRPGSFTGGWTLLAGIWVVLMTLRLHLMGVALRRLSVASHGAAGLARQWLPLAVVLGAVGVLAWSVAGAWPSLRALTDGPGVFAAVQAITAHGAAGVVLWPFAALVRLPLAASAGEFLAALPGGGAAARAQLRVGAAFGCGVRGGLRGVRRAAGERPRGAPSRREGAGATPFSLAPDGRPEPAILWKNLILVGRYMSLRTALRLLPLVILLAVAARGSAGHGVAAVMGAAALPLCRHRRPARASDAAERPSPGPGAVAAPQDLARERRGADSRRGARPDRDRDLRRVAGAVARLRTRRRRAGRRRLGCSRSVPALDLRGGLHPGAGRRRRAGGGAQRARGAVPGVGGHRRHACARHRRDGAAHAAAGRDAVHAARVPPSGSRGGGGVRGRRLPDSPARCWWSHPR